jgi:hypothetical protein
MHPELRSTAPSPSRPLLLCVIVGVVVGVVVPIGSTATWTVNPGCAAGPVLGSSGPVLTPYVIAAPPPGGLVAWNLTVQESPLTSTTGGSTGGPVNVTETVADVFNWTLRQGIYLHHEPWSEPLSCPQVVAPAGRASQGASLRIAGPTPSGVGERTVVPAHFTLGNWSSVTLNVSYPSAATASFNWSSSGPDPLGFSGGPGWGALDATASRYYNGSVFVGLGITVQLSSVGFGVPIRLPGKLVDTYPASVPAAFGGGLLRADVTYVFPASVDQGSWEIFEAGAGSAFPVGGLLFEQTA